MDMAGSPAPFNKNSTFHTVNDDWLARSERGRIKNPSPLCRPSSRFDACKFHIFIQKRGKQTQRIASSTDLQASSMSGLPPRRLFGCSLATDPNIEN
jgi:hypothetical protein